MCFVGHEPPQVASAIGTTDFVTWEFIPFLQPLPVLAGNITLTAKRNKLNVVRGKEPLGVCQLRLPPTHKLIL